MQRNTLREHLCVGECYDQGQQVTPHKSMAALCDLALRGELLLAGVRHMNLWRFLLSTLRYCVAVPFLRFLLFQRFDLWHARLSLSALLLFGSGGNPKRNAAPSFKRAEVIPCFNPQNLRLKTSFV